VAAFPGGILFVPASLILAAKDEDELAGMLAHAIAHVASRDGARQATRAQLMDIAMPAPYMGGWTMELGLLRMWRKRELDADRLAASKMAAAGYDPGALARYLDREQASYDEYSPKMYSMLPRRAQRIEAIQSVIDTLPARTYPARDAFSAFQEQVRRLTVGRY